MKKLWCYLSNPKKIFVYLDNLLRLNLIRLKAVYNFPSILPSTFIWKFLPAVFRFNFYNKLFTSYPVGSFLIQCFDSNNVKITKHSLNIYCKSSAINLNPLITEGYLVIPDVINSDDYSNFCESLKLNSDFKSSRFFSYNDNTFFYLFDSSWLKSSNSFLPVFDVVNQVSQLFFGDGVYPSVGIQCIKANHNDHNDPNTIPHIDRFIPCLKAFYFPFDVDLNGSPFGFSPGSHIINDTYRSFFLQSLRHRTKHSHPFTMPADFMYNYPVRKLQVASNSLVFAFTNGVHCRTPFDHFPSQRWSIVFSWYDSLKKLHAFNNFISNPK